MFDADFLFVIAEIAAAFAGFSTLVVVVSQGRGSAGTASGHRLVSMLRLSLLVILCSLIPYLPSRLGLAEASAWRLSSGFFAILWVVYYVSGLRLLGPKAGRLHASLINKINFFGVETLAILGLAAGALGAWGNQVAFVYLCSLLAMLYVSGWLFLELVIQIARREPAAQPSDEVGR